MKFRKETSRLVVKIYVADENPFGEDQGKSKLGRAFQMVDEVRKVHPNATIFVEVDA